MTTTTITTTTTTTINNNSNNNNNKSYNKNRPSTIFFSLTRSTYSRVLGIW